MESLFDRKPVDEKTLQEEKVSSGKMMDSLKEIFKGVKVKWGTFIFGCICYCVSYFILAMTAMFSADVQMGKMTDMSKVAALVIMHLVAWVIGLGGYFGAKAYIRVCRDVQDKLWKRIVRLPMTEYHKESPERLISRVTFDVEYVAAPFLVLIMAGVILVVGLVGIFGMPATHYMIRLSFFLGVVVILVLMVFACKVAYKAYLMMSNRMSKITAFWSEKLFQIRLIKASCTEERQVKEAERIIDMRYEAKRYNAFATLLNESIAQMATLVNLTATFLVGAILVSKAVEGVDISAVYGFYSYASMLAICIGTFAVLPVMFAALSGGAKKFVKILRTPLEDVETGEDLKEEQGDITFDEAGFSYDDKEMVLQDISCTIPAGKVTALAGQNGSGKSTMIKLVDRLYPLSCGDLKFAGQSAKDVSLKSWRSKFGVVSQNASLFSGTIRENVCYGLDREVSQEELDAAAKNAGLDRVFAAHSDGWDTQVGMAGGYLSGGEQQRVAIARALVKNPDYLVLDEATANLDAESAHEIIFALKKLMEGRTTIMVAHNEELLQAADCVIRLDGGKVAGQE